MKFPFYKQYDAMDCGPTCIKMVAQYYGKSYSLQNLRDKSHITREGVSMMGISDAAEAIGFRTMGVKIGFDKLATEAPLPCIVHWKQNHFAVVYKIKKKGEDYKVYVSNPAVGRIKYTKEEFIKGWLSTADKEEGQGICLLLDPTPDFYTHEGDELKKDKVKYLFKYLKPHKRIIYQLFLAFITGSIIQLILPFLTQSIVDVGISNSNINFIKLVLVGQLILFASKTAVDFIRSWILLHISTRINISLISDFLAKLMRLPIGFFDTKMIGDLMQRIGDHSRIENFLTSTTLNILFSMVNLVIFSMVLLYYNVKIFAVFAVGSLLYILYVNIFMKKRRELDNKRFAQMSGEQSNLIQMITGMQEIKLNRCETQKRWEWERIQANLFRVNMKSMALNQYQQAGSVFINEVKNLLISFMAATAVVNGEITLGMMLAIQYIIGQMNSPIDQTIGFMRSWQDAKISLERLGEIHNKEDEEKDDVPKLDILPTEKSIDLENLTFQYEGPHSPKVLEDINFSIPEGKVTAIVGTSGSGKTTLMKLILGFYDPVEGKINLGKNVNLKNFSQKKWRTYCGSVMQDGFIFSDSIANNIALGEETIDKERLLYAVKTANIQEHIESLPLTYNTKIGNEGVGLSQGQKQRILIARAVYKNPDYIFLDEATNALDANNEKVIMENLDEFFKDRTVVVIAHRLSTVKNADQIIVLEKGKMVEKGNHAELTKLKGEYYRLVRNQLELGS